MVENNLMPGTMLALAGLVGDYVVRVKAPA